MLTDECGRSTRSWLIEEHLFSPAAASRATRLVRLLPLHPQTRDAYFAGDISSEHALVILDGLKDVRDDDLREPVETALIQLARELPPHEVAQGLDQILASLGVEQSSDEAAARRHSRRGVSLARTFGGTGSLSGTLSPLLTEKLAAAFSDCTKPIDETDERDAGQRRHDLLEEMVDGWLGRTEVPGEAAPRARHRIVVTIPLETLEAELSAKWGLLDSGAPIAPETARRLACNEGIIPAVLNSRSAPIDLGIDSRSFSEQVRRAALLRDGGRCGFPRCRRPVVECHHIVWWSRGGKSTLENAVWLCAYHHWLAHEGGWSLRREADGSYTWTGKHGQIVTGDPPARHPWAA